MTTLIAGRLLIRSAFLVLYGDANHRGRWFTIWERLGLGQTETVEWFV